MSREINPFGLRMPPSLRAMLEEAARDAGRSLNAEIVHRLLSPTSPALGEKQARRAAILDALLEAMHQAEVWYGDTNLPDGAEDQLKHDLDEAFSWFRRLKRLEQS